MSQCCPPDPADDQAAHCEPPSRPDWLLRSSLAVLSVAYLSSFLIDSISDTSPWYITFSHSVMELVHTMWLGVALGVIMVAVLARIPREFVMAVLGSSSGLSSILRATTAGVFLDLCSHGILMVGSKLYERGASLGQLMAFLIASPWNSFSLTLVLITLIGLPWTLAFIALSMAIAVLTGLVFDQLVRRGVLPDNPHKSPLPTDFAFWKEAKCRLQSTEFSFRFIASSLFEGLKSSRIVLRWLLFGIVLASLVRTLVSAEHFASFFGPSLLGLAMTVIAATVIEVCSEGAAPIAGDLLNRAQAPGNSFAFLMAGVSTDYTEIMVLKDTTHSLKTALFLPLITLPQVLLIAWLINTLQ